MADLQARIEDLWERRDDLGNGKKAKEAVAEAIDLLDRGEARVAEVADGRVVVRDWLKEAILLTFRLAKMREVEVGPFEYLDKLPLKSGYKKAGVRVVPGASARRGAFLSRGVIMMPSYVNIGAWVGPNTMVDTWATVGSCAQVGANVHLSGGVGVGGVLEPPQAAPVVIEDDCFIGSRCIVAEGAWVERNCVLGAGCILTGSVPVIDAQTGAEIGRGHVPANSLAVSATRARRFGSHEYGLPCVLVIKNLREGERHDKALLNDILREHGATLG
jgi:2,3,4,5-tetrahydropyridine-2-carboxylate N-succinyltransferase